jgi:conjugal transfer/type IV secretion protein DotA/TraY
MSAADSGTTLSATALANTLASYRTELTEQIQSQAQSVIGNSSSGLASQLTSQGWVMAGSYWSDMARIKDTITNAGSAAALTAPPSTMAREGFFGSGDMLNSVEGITTRYEVLADELTKQALANPASTSSDPNAQVLPTFQSDFSLNDFTAGDQGVRETFTRIFNYIPGLVVRRIVGAMNTSDDPLMTVKNVGDSITALANAVLFWKGAVTAILSGLGTAAASSSIPGTSALAGIVQGMYTWFTQTFGFLSPGLWGLLYIGYWLGIWLPMVPFYVFAIGVVGWLVFVVEMMAAGMLWAAAHTTPARNNSFIGSQMQGYLLVMSGFFRPALMVLGLVASNALLGPAVSFINAAFIAKFTSMTQDSLTMITGVAAYLLSYAFLVTSTFMLVFGLPQSLPDRILRWIGAGIGDLGEQDTTARIERQAGNNSRNAILQGIKHAADQRNNEHGSDTPKTAPTADSDREAERAAAPMTDTGPVPLLEQGGGERT